MLPKIEQPVFKIKLPSTKENVSIRPMLVKEEKILLMAKEGGEIAEKLSAVKQVVTNCLVSGDIDTNKITIFDLEYLFLKIRALSVDNIVNLTYQDNEEDEPREFEINLDNVQVDDKEAKNNIIEIDKNSGLTLRYPTASLYENAEVLKASDESIIFDEFVADSLVNYYSGEEVYNFNTVKKEEIVKWINENIGPKTYYKIKEFLENVPSLRHVIEYKNKNGKERKIVLQALNDFFMF